MKTPIPAFYCCYLLRSSVKRQAVYVGSTPNIVRRWKQHNGIATGGAVQTARDSLRPWDVVCIVHGFPSRSAALQFEWAWQKTHLTRHVAASQRAAVKARVSVPGKIANLHLLLRSKSFGRWPLSLRFFADDVYRVWKTWDSRMSESIRPGINVVLDPLASSARPGASNLEAGAPLNVPPALAALDMGFRSFKGHAQKAQSLLESKEHLSCSVCKARLYGNRNLTLVCPHNGCTAVSHLSCLSEHFMASETDKSQLMPLSGYCPTCHTPTNWSTLVTELTLRTRGQPFLEKLFKAPRGKKAKLAEAAAIQAGTATAAQALVEDGDDVVGDQEDDEWIFQQFDDDFDTLPSLDDIVELDGDDDQIPPSAQGQGSKWIESQDKDLVIDDSDWDNAEVLD